MIELKGKYCRDVVVFNDEVEESAMTLIWDIANSPAFAGSKIRIMPDVHAGKGIVIGFTVPLDKFVAPSHVGVDIGCTIDSWFTNVSEGSVDRVRLESDIRRAVKFGSEYQEHPCVSISDFCKYADALFREWHSAWPERIGNVRITEKYVTDTCRKLGMDETVFWKSLGTVGSGNHFIEVGVHEGKLVYTIHCGSRNLGVKIAKYHERVASTTWKNAEFKREREELIANLKRTGESSKIQGALVKLREKQAERHVPGYLTGDEMSAYLTDMAFGVAYALYNHEIISVLVRDALRAQVPNANIVDVVRSIHNYVDFTDHVIRKGAIRAYSGERCVIPFNMRDGLAICTGKSCSDWNCSAPHGAGRVMSRAAAKRDLSVDEFRAQMEGITSTSVGVGTIDEAPGAYKDPEVITSLIGDTVDVIAFIRPLINLKDKNTAEED